MRLGRRDFVLGAFTGGVTALSGCNVGSDELTVTSETPEASPPTTAPPEESSTATPTLEDSSAATPASDDSTTPPPTTGSPPSSPETTTLDCSPEYEGVYSASIQNVRVGTENGEEVAVVQYSSTNSGGPDPPEEEAQPVLFKLVESQGGTVRVMGATISLYPGEGYAYEASFYTYGLDRGAYTVVMQTCSDEDTYEFTLE